MTKFSASQQSQLAQIGAFLRENREKQGKSLEDIAIHTYIRPQLLNGIETGNPDLLPEPIFVQGFIRRYAENLGLKGLEIAQQFTVTSIPSTPRPARRTDEPESSTTRLTRSVPAPSATTSPPPPAADSNALFSAGSLSPLGEPFPNSEKPADTSQPVSRSPAEVPLIVDDAVLEMQTSQVNTPDVTSPESPTPERLTDDIPVAPNIPVAPTGRDSADAGAINVPDLTPANIPPNSLETTEATPQFDDELPATFTTQVTTTEPGTAPRTAYASEPVGVEIGNSEGPNLKPFAIGAVVVAAITAGMVLLANVLGRDPSVADAPDPVATEPTTETLEPVEPIEPVAPAPVSTAPVYVETEATEQTYVSIKVDGVIVYEDTMEAGDTQLWEGQEVIDVYSGNAGGLLVSANGDPAEVLGERGQLGQSIFEAE